MAKYIIFGNSGSGKSTLAKQLVTQHHLAHLDLDTIAWLDTQPPQRQDIAISQLDIHNFLTENQEWVVEGCYSDLLSIVLPHADKLIFLDLPTSLCIKNARLRPWEPHKYPNKTAQDANLPMLESWINNYNTRSDTFSRQAHQALYDTFIGDKSIYIDNQSLC